MKIYLAGPMSGLPFFNHPAFNHAAKELRAKGHEVFNPAELDNATYAHTPPESGNVEEATKGYGFDYKKCLRMDLEWIFDNAEAIALLPGWESSKGANAELALARALGLQLFLVDVPHGLTADLPDYWSEVSENLSAPRSTVRGAIITHVFKDMPVTR